MVRQCCRSGAVRIAEQAKLVPLGGLKGRIVLVDENLIYQSESIALLVR